MDHLLAGRPNEAAAAMGRHIERGADTAAEWLRQVYEGREHAAAAATATPAGTARNGKG